MTTTPHTTHPHVPHDQRARWMKYGTNVAVLILAALVIVVFLNWIVARSVTRAPWMRMDLTESRQYSLSPQTMRVLNNLSSDVNITLLSARGSVEPELLTRVDDLMAEYGRRSPHVKVRSIDPAADPESYDKFLGELLERFPDQVKQNREAFADIKKLYARIGEFAKKQTTAIPALMSKLPPDAQAADAGQIFRQLFTLFTLIGEEAKGIGEQIDKALDEKLPDFASLRTALTQAGMSNASLGQLSRTLKKMVEVFDRLTLDPATPAAVKDAVLGLKKEYAATEKEVTEGSRKLDGINTADYDRLRSSLSERNSVVVSIAQAAAKSDDAATDKTTDKPAAKPADKSKKSDDHGVAVLGFTEIFPNLILSRMSEEVRPEQGYKGEEVITGAVLRLTNKHKTKVVFVNGMPAPVLMRMGGQSGQPTFSNVAERLEKMNYEVTEWQPTGGMGPFGQPMPPQPPPVAEPGQKMVYVVLPIPGPNPQNPAAVPPGAAIATAVKAHIDSGQPAIIFASPSNMMSMGQPDALADIYKGLGLTVQTNRTILQQRAGDRVITTNQIVITDWSDKHPVSAAIQGLRGIIVQGLPIELPAAAPEGTQQWPLAKSPIDCWSAADVMAEPSRIKPSDADPKGPFTVAAAVQKDKSRAIVISDPIWASDMVTMAGPRDMTGAVVYSALPANAELFINGVSWVAGLDDLIAPGARTQDVRRIGNIARPAYVAVWWILLAGLPLACLAAGAAMYVVRRR